ncbi:carbonic anhydrase [Myxococcota bacterium]|nr:carbonic anhydrase [Myxococcota bacterium]
MQKLLAGIHDFHRRVRPGYVERFAHLALGQAPDCLFVACADSRVVPNLFASTDPGDLFVLRNVGNIVPACCADPSHSQDGSSSADSVGAGVEFALQALDVRDVVVCGHSACGAMRALATGQWPADARHLGAWLAQARPSLARLEREPRLDAPDPVDRLSQAHVLQQLDHLRSYPEVARREAEGRLALHAWWFDLARAEVLAWDATSGRFLPLVRET